MRATAPHCFFEISSRARDIMLPMREHVACCAIRGHVGVGWLAMLNIMLLLLLMIDTTGALAYPKKVAGYATLGEPIFSNITCDSFTYTNGCTCSTKRIMSMAVRILNCRGSDIEILRADSRTLSAVKLQEDYSDMCQLTIFPEASGSYTVLADYVEVLSTVYYRTTAATKNREVYYHFNPTTSGRSYYSEVTRSLYAPLIGTYTWLAGQSACAEHAMFGLRGYLVTVSSKMEHDFIEEITTDNEVQLEGQVWLGLSDVIKEGEWRWVTGPDGQCSDPNARGYLRTSCYVANDDRYPAVTCREEQVARCEPRGTIASQGFQNWGVWEPGTGSDRGIENFAAMDLILANTWKAVPHDESFGVLCEFKTETHDGRLCIALTDSVGRGFVIVNPIDECSLAERCPDPGMECIDQTPNTMLLHDWECVPIDTTAPPPTPIPPTPAPATQPPPSPMPPTPAPPTPLPPTDTPPTPVPSTALPPTPAPTTSAPPTPIPDTAVPPTESPPTPAPETNAPPTDTPPTPAPSTAVPPTLVPDTAAPPTISPPTPAPETNVPPTPAPSTAVPPTLVPDTAAPMTSPPPTPVPATAVPATGAPPTRVPATDGPPTRAPGTPRPGRSTDVPVDAPTPEPPVMSSGPARFPPHPPRDGVDTDVPPGPVDALTTPPRALQRNDKWNDASEARLESAGTAAAVLGLAGGVSAGGAARLAVLRSMDCRVDDVDLYFNEPLDYEFHITGVAIGTSRSRYLVGAVVMNATLLAAFVLVTLFVSWIVGRHEGSFTEGLAATKAPGIFVIPITFFVPGTSLVAARLLFFPATTGAAGAALGGVALLLCAAAPVVIYWYVVRHISVRAYPVKDGRVGDDFDASAEMAGSVGTLCTTDAGADGAPLAPKPLAYDNHEAILTRKQQAAVPALRGFRREVYRLVFGDYIWVSSGGSYFCDLHGIFFDNYRPGHAHMLLVELATHLTLSVFAAWTPVDRFQCHTRNFIISCLNVALCARVLRTAPFFAPLDNLMSLALSGTQAAAVVLMTLGIMAHSPRDGSVFVAAEVLLFISSGLVMLKGVLDLVIRTIDVYLDRRRGMRELARITAIERAAATYDFDDVGFGDALDSPGVQSNAHNGHQHQPSYDFSTALSPLGASFGVLSRRESVASRGANGRGSTQPQPPPGWTGVGSPFNTIGDAADVDTSIHDDVGVETPLLQQTQENPRIDVADAGSSDDKGDKATTASVHTPVDDPHGSDVALRIEGCRDVLSAGEETVGTSLRELLSVSFASARGGGPGGTPRGRGLGRPMNSPSAPPARVLPSPCGSVSDLAAKQQRGGCVEHDGSGSGPLLGSGSFRRRRGLRGPSGAELQRRDLKHLKRSPQELSSPKLTVPAAVQREASCGDDSDADAIGIAILPGSFRKSRGHHSPRVHPHHLRSLREARSAGDGVLLCSTGGDDEDSAGVSPFQAARAGGFRRASVRSGTGSPGVQLREDAAVAEEDDAQGAGGNGNGNGNGSIRTNPILPSLVGRGSPRRRKSLRGPRTPGGLGPAASGGSFIGGIGEEDRSSPMLSVNPATATATSLSAITVTPRHGTGGARRRSFKDLRVTGGDDDDHRHTPGSSRVSTPNLSAAGNPRHSRGWAALKGRSLRELRRAVAGGSPTLRGDDDAAAGGNTTPASGGEDGGGGMSVNPLSAITPRHSARRRTLKDLRVASACGDDDGSSRGSTPNPLASPRPHASRGWAAVRERSLRELCRAATGSEGTPTPSPRATAGGYRPLRSSPRSLRVAVDTTPVLAPRDDALPSTPSPRAPRRVNGTSPSPRRKPLQGSPD